MPNHFVALQSSDLVRRADNQSRQTRPSGLFPFAFSALLLFALTAVAAAQLESKPVGRVGDTSGVTIAHSSLLLRNATNLGPLDEAQQLDRMILVLKMSPQRRKALATLLDSQQTRGSANYHRWLTPDEFGQQFGPAPQDLASIQSWLGQQGFQVGKVAQSGMWIEFSGTAGQVNRAFQTRMRRYQINGETHIANASDISIPSALAPLVEGVPLHDFFSKPMFVHSHSHGSPAITAPWNSVHAMIPGDFATIYDLNQLYKAGLNGKGQTIAIVAEADITPSDISAFQSIFGLPSNLPNVIEDGTAPGVDLSLGYGTEATIDSEWASAAAPGAAIDLVVSEPGTTTDGIALSALYIVDHNLAQIVSVSFGECEQELGTAGNAMWNSLWAQAAAQGMSVFVASGDDGSVMCNAGGMDFETGYGPMSVNGLASTPYTTAVGGTEFDEGANGGSASTF